MCTRKYLETLLRRWVARSSPQHGWTRTTVARPGQTIETTVGREVKYDKRLDLFSAAQPLKTLKFLCARVQAGRKPHRLAVIDIKMCMHISTRLSEDRSSSKFPQRTCKLETKDAWASWSLALFPPMLVVPFSLLWFVPFC